MAKSIQLKAVINALHQEERLLSAQLGRVQDAIAALSDVTLADRVRPEAHATKTAPKTRRTMTTEQRSAVSTRMKKYWAERRKSKR